MPEGEAHRQRRFRHAPPQRQPGHIDRPRIVRLLDERTGTDPTLLVVAPSGYGKTSAVSEWASTHPGRVAWLTVGPFETDSARLGLEVLRALQELARSEGAPDLQPLLEIAAGELVPAEMFELLTEALDRVAAPVYLVVDDAHRAQDQIREGLLGALIGAEDSPLRLLIIGTSYLEIALNRLVLSRPHLTVRAHDLAFDLDEIESLSARLSLPIDPQTTLAETKGWPIAIRLVQITGVRPGPDGAPDESLMREYVKEHLLSSVPAEIAEFALLTSVCAEMSAGMAAAVSGRDDSAELLERCVHIGLFIDRYDTPDGAMYRWHAVFARYCRAILEATRPETRRTASASAAAFAVQGNPLLAMSYWVQAGETERAVETMLAHWPELVVGPEAPALLHWCASLPHPYDDDPRVLLVRACAQDITGASDVARMLLAHAEARAQHLDDRSEYEAIRVQVLLQLVDDRDELAVVATRARDQLRAPSSMSARTRAAVTYLLGFAELRLRRSPELIIQLLSSAAVEAEAVGNGALARRSLDHLSYVLAWTGRQREAQAVLDRRHDTDDDESWTAYGGAHAAAATAAGHIAYWGDDLDRAQAEFTRAMRGGSSPLAFAGIARMMLAFTAAASRDPGLCHRAARELQAIPQQMHRGVSWPAFRDASRAALHEAAGHRAQAMKIVEHYAESSDLPLVSVLLSGIAMRAGRAELAASMLSRQERYLSASYIVTAKLAADALVRAQRALEDPAHELVEQALEIASAEDVRRPFSGGGIAMRKLLTEHLAWGTRHEQFISECLALRTTSGPQDQLSERENAVFSQLRTTKTMQEIAEVLGVSINTVKTHQRSIYRKLGVASRREAVRFFS
ncbi:LuxR C-terminal-related transcriptional regulator [Leucobacter sp.]